MHAKTEKKKTAFTWTNSFDDDGDNDDDDWSDESVIHVNTNLQDGRVVGV